MNKVFELAKQAGLIEWDTLSSGAVTPTYDSVVRAQQFAELIVQECANIVIKVGSEQLEDKDAVIYSGAIKGHFGVE